jgi:heme oxygenase (biliverdin-IX-beta and delta-forming)
MNNPSLGEWLKHEMRADHHRVDQHPLLKPLLRRDLTITEYTAALCGLYAPIASLEQSLSLGLHGYGVDYSLIARKALLKADIHQLGGQVTSLGFAPVPVNVANLVGMLYVLEGSRLGGAMIARHVSDVLGSQVPLRFLTDHPLYEEQWAAFWRFAEQHVSPVDWPAVRMGAQQAFEHFTQGLSNSELSSV